MTNHKQFSDPVVARIYSAIWNLGTFVISDAASMARTSVARFTGVVADLERRGFLDRSKLDPKDKDNRLTLFSLTRNDSKRYEFGLEFLELSTLEEAKPDSSFVTDEIKKTNLILDGIEAQFNSAASDRAFSMTDRGKLCRDYDRANGHFLSAKMIASGGLHKSLKLSDDHPVKLAKERFLKLKET
ncbi:MAG TPA: hypothetical protein VIF12_00495, partial [Micavibrio sp.]